MHPLGEKKTPLLPIYSFILYLHYLAIATGQPLCYDWSTVLDFSLVALGYIKQHMESKTYISNMTAAILVCSSDARPISPLTLTRPCFCFWNLSFVWAPHGLILTSLLFVTLLNSSSYPSIMVCPCSQFVLHCQSLIWTSDRFQSFKSVT